MMSHPMKQREVWPTVIDICSKTYTGSQLLCVRGCVSVSECLGVDVAVCLCVWLFFLWVCLGVSVSLNNSDWCLHSYCVTGTVSGCVCLGISAVWANVCIYMYFCVSVSFSVSPSLETSMWLWLWLNVCNMTVWCHIDLKVFYKNQYDLRYFNFLVMEPSWRFIYARG